MGEVPQVITEEELTPKLLIEIGYEESIKLIRRSFDVDDVEAHHIYYGVREHESDLVFETLDE